MRILAVDPGRTTGWVDYYDGSPVDTTYGESSFGAVVEAVERRATYLDVIVCERFTINPYARNSNQTDALEVIGYLRSVAQRFGTGYRLQMPGDAKSFGTDDRLIEQGLYFPGQDHARDAARHLLLFLAKEGLYAPE